MVNVLTDDEDAGFDDIIRAKWCMDGAETLGEAASMLRSFAEYLELLESQGWQLKAPVEDDYGFVAQAKGDQ